MTAMQSALHAIERAFPAARTQCRKDHIRQIMRLAPSHPEVRFRYQKLADRYPTVNLQVAIILVERLYQVELRQRDVAVRLWGRVSRPQLALMLLTEARIILRWMRRYDPGMFADARGLLIKDG